MTSQADEDRWGVWTVQARNFAKRDQYPDAVARMRLVRNSIRAALDAQADPSKRARLTRQLARAQETLAEIESQSNQWRTAIATRRQQTIDQAAEEMARPLPLDVDQR